MPTPTESAAAGPVDAFWRYRMRAVPVCIALGLLAAVFAFRAGGDTQVITNVYLTDPRGVPVFRDGTTAATDMATYLKQRAEFAQSDTTLEQVANAVGDGLTVDRLREIVETTVADSSSIVVTCTSDDSTLAFAVCAAVTESYTSLTRADTQRRADIAIGELEQRRQALLAEISPGQTTGSIGQIEVDISQTAKQAALFDAGVEFVDSPRAVESSRIIPVAQYGIAAFAFGLILTGAIAWLAAMRRPVVNDPEEAATQLGAPLMGVLEDRSSSAGVEVLATNLASVTNRGVVVVTGSLEASNHSDLVAGIAEAWTREGRTVLVVDGNLRKPRLSARFGAGLSSVGLTDLLGGLATEMAAIRTVKLPDGPSLSFIACGQSVDHASSLLRSTTSRAVLSKLQERFDVVLVDAPPIMDRAEGSALASVADGVVMVVPSGTPSSDLNALRRRLDVLRAPLLGVIYDDGAR